MTQTPKACAVCGLVVETVVEGRNGALVEYRHTLGTVFDGGDDHPVVPVDYSEIRVRTKCDFCYTENARWSLPVEDYDMGDRVENVGDWSACDRCAALLRKDDWTKLAARAQIFFERAHGPIEEGSLAALYAVLRQHVTGTVRLTHPEQGASAVDG